jgi:acyl-CoA thioester hydrolase
MALHVDMTAGRAAAFPSHIAAGLAKMKAAHAELPVPEAAGRRVAMPERA